MQIGKEEVKVSLFTDDMIVYVSELYQGTLTADKDLQSSDQKQDYCFGSLYTNNKWAEKEVRK